MHLLLEQQYQKQTTSTTTRKNKLALTRDVKYIFSQFSVYAKHLHKAVASYTNVRRNDLLLAPPFQRPLRPHNTRRWNHALQINALVVYKRKPTNFVLQ